MGESRADLLLATNRESEASVYTRSWLSITTHAGLRRARRHWIAIGIPVAIPLILVYAIAFLTDEPLRRYTETKMNYALKGYTARIGKLDLHPLGYSLDLHDVVITQDAHPDPPVLRITHLSASVHWRALLSGRLVGDVELEQPTVYLNLPQARKEITDPTPVKERGWQDALEAIYPLKINHFEIRGGDITYVDNGPFKPLRVANLDLVATNIRNRSSKRPYPSDVQFSAVVFDSGRLSADGQANFLAEPNPTFRGDVELADIELDYFKPITCGSTRAYSRRPATSSMARTRGRSCCRAPPSTGSRSTTCIRRRPRGPSARRGRRRRRRPGRRAMRPTCSCGSTSSASRRARSGS